MASTSAPSGLTESEPATTSQGVPQFSSSSSPSCSRSCLFPSRRSAESNSMPSTSDTTLCTPQNEASTSYNPMASSSATSAGTESELATTSQGLAQSSPPSSPSSSRSLFSCCLDWVSLFPSWRSMESNSMASTSDTIVCIPENEAFQGMAPSASDMGRSSTLIQKPCYDVFINHRGPDVKKTLASKIYNILCDMKVPTFLDSEELDYGDFFPETLQAAIRGATLHIAIFSKRYAESAWCLDELSLMLRSGAKIIPIFYLVDPIDLRYVDRR